MSAKRKTPSPWFSMWDRADKYVARHFDSKWKYPTPHEAFIEGYRAAKRDAQRSARAAGKKGRGK